MDEHVEPADRSPLVLEEKAVVLLAMLRGTR